MRCALLPLLFLLGCKRGPDANEARTMLASPDEQTRQIGATALQKIYARDPRALGDHGEAYWVLRLKGLPNASEAETLRILDGAKAEGSEGGGGGSTRHYQLDDFWATDLYNDDRRGRTMSYEPPRRRVVHVYVERPPGFTGTWNTYFVNGAVHDALELDHGILTRNRAYHENGHLQLEYLYVDGLVEGTFITRFADGKTQFEETFAKGKQVGVHKWFYESGKLRQEDHWADAKLDGRLTNYAESGAVTSCADYRAGVEIGRDCDAPAVK